MGGQEGARGLLASNGCRDKRVDTVSHTAGVVVCLLRPRHSDEARPRRLCDTHFFAAGGEAPTFFVFWPWRSFHDVCLPLAFTLSRRSRVGARPLRPAAVCSAPSLFRPGAAFALRRPHSSEASFAGSFLPTSHARRRRQPPRPARTLRPARVNLFAPHAQPPAALRLPRPAAASNRTLGRTAGGVVACEPHWPARAASSRFEGDSSQRQPTARASDHPSLSPTDVRSPWRARPSPPGSPRSSPAPRSPPQPHGAASSSQPRRPPPPPPTLRRLQRTPRRSSAPRKSHTTTPHALRCPPRRPSPSPQTGACRPQTPLPAGSSSPSSLLLRHSRRRRRRAPPWW